MVVPETEGSNTLGKWRLLLVHICLLSFIGSGLVPGHVMGAPTMNGYTGLVNMPSARIEEDGTLRIGLSDYKPYTTFWSSLSILPRLELGARYTSIDNTVGIPGSDYGTFKDKAFDAKVMLLSESHYFPALSVGTMDFLGTRVFKANYAVLSKKLGPFDISLGYGDERIDGAFGGISYQPGWAKRFEFVYEYDAINYQEEYLAADSGADERKGGSTLAINYRWGWLGAQLAWQRKGDSGSTVGINGYVSIPLMQREFIPKLDEPAPFTKQRAEQMAQNIKRATISDWQTTNIHRANLIKALEAQDFKNVQVVLHDQQLEIGFSTRTITLVGRAAGRVVRTALLLGPTDIKSINVTYFTLTDMALVTYNFHNLTLLTRFFEGHVTYGDLLKGLTVSYADPATAKLLSTSPVITTDESQKTPEETLHRIDETEEPSTQVTKKEEQSQPLQPEKKHVLQWVPNEEGHAISLRKDDEDLSRFRFAPINIGIYFNDAGGALRYETFGLATYSQQLGRGLFFNTSMSASWAEDVSKVVDESNSVLPHVRSDVADYKRDSRVKLNNLMLNKFMQLRPRLYSRFSLGYYEEMFGGVGGQILYLPKQSSWAIDLAVDRVRKRETDGGFGFRDYTTTTAIASFHYQLPWYGITFTLRGGQFLAKDRGVRYEAQRRFRSGVRVGAWYTVTDGKDITKPGTPDDPYMDKGIFVSIPLGSMLTRDTRATGRFAVSPWTRDVGQMVTSPGDLYSILEDPLMLDWEGYHLLSDFHR